MADVFKVDIDRHDPDRSPASYVRSYQIEHHPSMTVLEVLAEIQGYQDDGLAFRSACQAGKCGSCAVSLNGKPVLACRTMVDGQDLYLGPLPNFLVVKDLIVDRARFEEGQARTVAYALETESVTSPAASLPDVEIDYPNLARCIGCLVCSSACPVAAKLDKQFPDPALLATTLSTGVRIKRNGSSAAPIERNADTCSLCLNCHVACPSGVALNRANAQAKDAYIQEQGQSLRDWLMGRAELMGQLGSLTPPLSNHALHNGIVRRGMEATLGISRHADMPAYTAPFKRWFADRSTQTDPATAERKVVYFVGCYGNYSDTQPGKDMVAALERLGVHVEAPEQRCCGLPLVSNGDMNSARQRAEANLASFQPWLEQGYDVIATCTSCSLMLKHDYTEVLGLEAAEEMAGRTYDLGEYLRLMAEAGELDLDELKPVPMATAYHTPCHLRAQQIDLPFIDLIREIPDFEVEVLDTVCCGLSGSYGFKAEKYDVSMDVGRHLFEALEAAEPDLALSECGTCQVQMHHGTRLPVAHPISILRQALEG
ncbi:MAG: Anaerobic glycerol-3-phosphate dehydrogenase subunit C [Anaerolineales bacterium]|nr:Anaerobic glycerol-3-phosphate dehydrogenase subunit C [Anaerolineales bacterium]